MKKTLATLLLMLNLSAPIGADHFSLDLKSPSKFQSFPGVQILPREMMIPEKFKNRKQYVQLDLEPFDYYGTSALSVFYDINNDEKPDVFEYYVLKSYRFTEDGMIEYNVEDYPFLYSFDLDGNNLGDDGYVADAKRDGLNGNETFYGLDNLGTNESAA